MKFISLFAGIGGFEEAIRRVHPDWECVFASEWDKYAAQIYDKNFNSNRYKERGKPQILQGDKPNTGINYVERTNKSIDTRDIRTVPTEEIPDHDLLVGGFPCQSFSIAGKRRGFDDTRGTLFFDVARILSDKRPRYFILENVKGLLSHDAGKTFSTIIGVLADIGYDVQWQVLNSKNFGVPQNRERVFIIGNLRGTSRPQVFPVRINDEVYNQSNEIKEEVHNVASTLTARQFSSWNGNYINQLNNPTHSNDRVYGTDGISPTLNTMQGGNRQPFVALTERRTEEAKRLRRLGIVKDTRNLKKLEPREDGIANTVTTGDIKNSSLTNGSQIRRLTPIECERLQGFPEIEKYNIIEVCLDHQKNCVNVEIKNPKLLKFVGNVEKKDLKGNALSAEKSLNQNKVKINKLVQPDVLIDCVENGVEIHSQEKLLLNAKNAEKKNWYHPHIKIDDFVQMLVGINIIKERIINFGEEELHQKEQSLTLQQNGKKQEKLYGKEIMQPVGDVENDLITLKELLKFTTLNHSDTENLEQKLQTLSLFVIRAINGYIPKEILNQDTFTVGIKTKVGYTYGVSDTQRYKCLGNAVTVNVVEFIIKNLM